MLYENEEQVKQLIINRSALILHENISELPKQSYERYLKIREYNIYTHRVNHMEYAELLGETLFYTAPNKEPFKEYLEIMEIYGRKTFNESVFYRMKELHKREYNPHEYIHTLVCVIPELCIPLNNDEYTVLLTDPYDSKPFVVRKDQFTTDMLTIPHLAEIGITSEKGVPDKLYRLTPLSKLQEKRNKSLAKGKGFVNAKDKEKKDERKDHV